MQPMRAALAARGAGAAWLALGLNLGRPGAVFSAWSAVQAIQILAAFVLMIASVVHTFRTVRDASR